MKSRVFCAGVLRACSRFPLTVCPAPAAVGAFESPDNDPRAPAMEMPSRTVLTPNSAQPILPLYRSMPFAAISVDAEAIVNTCPAVNRAAATGAPTPVRASTPAAIVQTADAFPVQSLMSCSLSSTGLFHQSAMLSPAFSHQCLAFSAAGSLLAGCGLESPL